jgi:hypothetical protein
LKSTTGRKNLPKEIRMAKGITKMSEKIIEDDQRNFCFRN